MRKTRGTGQSIREFDACRADKNGVRLARSASDCTWPRALRESAVRDGSGHLATVFTRSLEIASDSDGRVTCYVQKKLRFCVWNRFRRGVGRVQGRTEGARLEHISRREKGDAGSKKIAPCKSWGHPNGYVRTGLSIVPSAVTPAVAKGRAAVASLTMSGRRP